MKAYREEKRKVKRCIYQSKIKINKHYGREMNKDVNGNRKLFWKEVSNAKEGKVESCSRLNDGNGRLAQGEDELRKIWKEYSEDLYNIDTQEHVAVHMCSFDRIRRGNSFGEEPISRAEIEVRVGKLMNGNASGKDEIIREMIKGGGDMVAEWIWRLCNMAF